jgi:hypothetical protein
MSALPAEAASSEAKTDLCRLTKSRTVVTAKKRAQMAVANMVRASASQFGYAFASPGYALVLLRFVSPTHRGRIPQRSLLAATASQPRVDLRRF